MDKKKKICCSEIPQLCPLVFLVRVHKGNTQLETEERMLVEMACFSMQQRKEVENLG
jgi:hypothetical protein